VTSNTVTQSEQELLAHVLQMLGTGQATTQNLDDYVIGYAVLGRIVAIAQGEAERAEQERKVAWSRAFADAKASPEKTSDKLAEVKADLAVESLRLKEINSRERLTNLRNTWQAVEQAINAIKFLGRNGA
jgi:hypothetical protein